jgi:dihydrofolate reductase
MRKIVVFNMVTLDGFFEGPGHDITWHNVDAEFDQFAIENARSADALLFGRVTYEMMASYWPTEESALDSPEIAAMMNAFHKYVFSNTLRSADWQNSELLRGDLVKEVRRIKELPGKDILVFGSAQLAAGLQNAGLVDEYRLLVNPILLGNGTPLFQNIQVPHALRMVRSRSFKNGNILLVYQTGRD